MAPRRSAKTSRKSKAVALPRADGVTWLTAAEYARRVGITKPRMSDFFNRGMPFVEGKDAEGRRNSKLVNIHVADAWRLANTEVRIASDGTIRGLNLAGGADAPEGSPHVGSMRGEGVTPSAPAAAAPEPPLGPSPTPSPAPPPEAASQTANAAARIAEAKARDSEMAAEGRAINLAKSRGQVVDRDSALEIVLAFAKGATAIIERKPVERAARLAALLGSTPHAAMLALREITDELQAELAKLAGELERDMEGVGG